MFKLIVAMFLISAPEEPVHTMTYNHSAFPSETECMEFWATEDGEAVAGSMKLTARGHGLMVRFGCKEVKDNTI
jgi:hypothetical protein